MQHSQHSALSHPESVGSGPVQFVLLVAYCSYAKCLVVLSHRARQWLVLSKRAWSGLHSGISPIAAFFTHVLATRHRGGVPFFSGPEQSSDGYE